MEPSVQPTPPQSPPSKNASQAVPPWAWEFFTQECDRRIERDRRRFWNRERKDDEWIEEGELFADPARALALLFRVPEGFGRTYVDNPFLASSPQPADRAGLAGSLVQASAGLSRQGQE